MNRFRHLSFYDLCLPVQFVFFHKGSIPGIQCLLLTLQLSDLPGAVSVKNRFDILPDCDKIVT